tara:strand:+ start:1468 stop:1728 length:261 start_codon:yes stop_codon:yes gene_type:complete
MGNYCFTNANYNVKTNANANANGKMDTVNNIVDKVIDTSFSNMDNLNKKAVMVMQTEGMEAGVKHMFLDHVTGRALSYSEMRERYG